MEKEFVQIAKEAIVREYESSATLAIGYSGGKTPLVFSS